MCGICGIIHNDTSKQVDENILAKMMSTLFHRGPDEKGDFIRGNVGLGMRRLSIIDIKGGHQPIYNESKTVCAICNGEIYNYRELRKELEGRGHRFYTNSDVEVIVHLYEENPEGFVLKLRGMFSFGVYDLQKDTLFLVRDRLGIKPLFYTSQNGVFLFASELKALLTYPGLKKETSYEALSDYLTYLYIPSPATIFKGIYKLPPAYILTFRNGEVSLKQYWELDYGKGKDEGEEYYLKALLEELRESIKLHLMSEVPLGAFLSGGMDSSVIVALMSQVTNERIKTFSVGFDVSGFNELKFAKIIAERFNTEHHEINLNCDIVSLLPKIVSYFDEPFADSSAIPTYLISEFARRKVTVCLSGDGGDELFAGYSWTRRQKFIEDYNRLPSALRAATRRMLLRKDYIPDSKNKLFDKVKRFMFDADSSLERSFMRRKTCFSEAMKMGLLKKPVYSKMGEHRSISRLQAYLQNADADNDIEKLLFLDTKMYLPDDGLCKVDRMSMFNSLEVRVPFLDHKVVECAASIPMKYKLRGRSSKYLLKKAMKGVLPEEILKQRKLGFTIPLNSWFRDKLQNFTKEILKDGCCLSEIANLEYIRWIVNEHVSGRQDFGSQIYALIVLELWLKSAKVQLEG